MSLLKMHFWDLIHYADDTLGKFILISSSTRLMTELRRRSRRDQCQDARLENG